MNDVLYAPSHRQASIYHDLCYTSHEALAGMKNTVMGLLWGIDLTTHHTMSRCSTMELRFAPCDVNKMWQYLYFVQCTLHSIVRHTVKLVGYGENNRGRCFPNLNTHWYTPGVLIPKDHRLSSWKNEKVFKIFNHIINYLTLKNKIWLKN